MEKIIGESTPFPGATAENVHQQYDDSCAIKSQQMILESFGQHISEEQLVYEAEKLGIYTRNESGTEAGDVGRLLEEHGVGVHTQYGANTYDLVYELSQGHKVIVGVDANELWKPSVWQSLKDYVWCSPNHALVVTGIDTTDSDNVQVILSDPGSGEVAARYPMSAFVDAWSDSNCFMVATNDAPPCEFDANMINFDYNLGHLPMIGTLPYENFLYMNPYSFVSYFGVDGGESTGSMAAMMGEEEGGGESTGGIGAKLGVDGGESTGSMAARLGDDDESAGSMAAQLGEEGGESTGGIGDRFGVDGGESAGSFGAYSNSFDDESVESMVVKLGFDDNDQSLLANPSMEFLNSETNPTSACGGEGGNDGLDEGALFPLDGPWW